MEIPEIKSKSYRQWALAALRALDALGGVATPMKIEHVIRAMPDNPLSDLQWARVIKGKYLRWAKVELKKLGLVTGTGEWVLTDIGRAYLAAHKDTPIAWPNVMPMDPKAAGQIQAPLETVVVTDYAGYEVPTLRILAEGPSAKQSVMSRLREQLRPDLLPGDFRIMNTGIEVCLYRASWTLYNLKKAGEVGNPTTGTWEITDAGRERLERESARWSLKQFQDSKAKVRAEWSDAEAGTAKEKSVPPPSWPTKAWKELLARFDSELLSSFAERVRPDLGATPDLDRPLPRNIILYGPPGTGKTFVARAIAEALTGQPDPSADGPWTIVQFHPSYSYEDFVQGLRPALEHRELRYQVRKGPFLQICAAAEKDPDKFFVLVIDEINRGDPARIFGELLYALEYRGDPVDLALGGQLRVPQNLVVVGTMNSVDRSVALVDYALRRRFAFVRVDPDPDAIERLHAADPEGAQAAAHLLETFNEWIEERLDRDHVIGHSFFLNPAHAKLDQATLGRIWTGDIRPLLEEYFFGQAEVLREAHDRWMSALAESTAPDEVEESASEAAVTA